MNYAIILAGGKGKRFGNDNLPKQFLPLGEKPIIIHTLEQFEINNNIDKIIICTPKEWINYTKDLVDKYSLNKEKVFITEGGSDRNGSLYNGCIFIKNNFKTTKKDKIITHDSVRPFISQRIINENIEKLNDCEAVDTCIKATDTIVKSIDNEPIIEEIPNRKNMYQGQTPQSFYLEEWLKLYNNLTNEEKEILTDACKIYVLNNKKVAIVEGETFNIKITTPFDLKLANTLVEKRENK